MDIKNSNGLIGKYNNKDVCVTTRKEYDSFDNISNNMYYILKDHPTIEGHPMLLFRGRIKGYCKNDGGIKIYDRDVYYTRAGTSEISMKNRREYTYTTKDAPQLSKEEYLSIEALAQKVNDIIKEGLLYSDKLLKQEQERAQSLCQQ